METRSGKVTNVLFDTKPPSGRATRPFTVHRVQLNNGDEVEVGFKQTYKVGDDFNSEVEFKYGKWKEVRRLAGVPSNPSASAANPSSPASSGNGAPATFPIPKGNKEQAIIRQNALTNAVNAVARFTDGTPRGTFDEYTDQILATAYKFAEFSSGQREVRLAKDLTGDSED